MAGSFFLGINMEKCRQKAELTSAKTAIDGRVWQILERKRL
jgi:hypothetical protein